MTYWGGLALCVAVVTSILSNTSAFAAGEPIYFLCTGRSDWDRKAERYSTTYVSNVFVRSKTSLFDQVISKTEANFATFLSDRHGYDPRKGKVSCTWYDARSEAEQLLSQTKSQDKRLGNRTVVTDWAG